VTSLGTPFEVFAAMLVVRHDDRADRDLLNGGPDEQTETALKRLLRFHATTPLTSVFDKDIDLAGFGRAPVHFESAEDHYLLLSEIAEQLGWPLYKACSLVRLQAGYAIEDQRHADEERGDGRLGYEYMRMWVDLGISLTMDDPEAKPDAGGGKHSDAGDWLVSHDRLPLLLSYSPWGREFMDNTMPAMGQAMRAIWGDKLKSVPTYDVDGVPTGGTAFTDLFATDLTEAEALDKARRGPSLPRPRGFPF